MPEDHLHVTLDFLGEDTLDAEQARASLDRLEAIPAKWVLPGHGGPWGDGVTEAVRLIRAG